MRTRWHHRRGSERTIAPLEIEMGTERITESALGNCGPSVQIYLPPYHRENELPRHTQRAVEKEREAVSGEMR